jgi:hypothetical protein
MALLHFELLAVLCAPSGLPGCLLVQLLEAVQLLSGLGKFRLRLLACGVLARQCILAGHDLSTQARFPLAEQADLATPLFQVMALGQAPHLRIEQALLLFAGPAPIRQVRLERFCLVRLCRLQAGLLIARFVLGPLQSALLDG